MSNDKTYLRSSLCASAVSSCREHATQVRRFVSLYVCRQQLGVAHLAYNIFFKADMNQTSKTTACCTIAVRRRPLTAAPKQTSMVVCLRHHEPSKQDNSLASRSCRPERGTRRSCHASRFEWQDTWTSHLLWRCRLSFGQLCASARWIPVGTTLVRLGTCLQRRSH